jgi:MFS transporter, DHA1 family, inner membrane transport protein
MASAVNIGAFNLGNALAAWLGGVVIAAGYGYASTSWVGAAMTAAALALAVVSGVLDRPLRGRTARCAGRAAGT